MNDVTRITVGMAETEWVTVVWYGFWNDYLSVVRI